MSVIGNIFSLIIDGMAKNRDRVSDYARSSGDNYDSDKIEEWDRNTQNIRRDSAEVKKKIDGYLDKNKN